MTRRTWLLLLRLPDDAFRRLPDGVFASTASRPRKLCRATASVCVLSLQRLRLALSPGEQLRRRKPAYRVASVSELVARVEDRSRELAY